MANRVFVGKIHQSTSEQTLNDEFSKCGEVTKIDLKNGYAFIFYATEEDCTEAINTLNGKEIDGNAIVVEATRARTYEKSRPIKRFDLRLSVSGLDNRVSWQDLKDWARKAGDVTFTNIFVKDGVTNGVIEFADVEGMETALRTLEGVPLKGLDLRLEKDQSGGADHGASRGDRDNYQRDDNFRRPYMDGPLRGYDDHRGPPGGMRYDPRDRSYDSRDRGDRGGPPYGGDRYVGPPMGGDRAFDGPPPYRGGGYADYHMGGAVAAGGDLRGYRDRRPPMDGMGPPPMGGYGGPYRDRSRSRSRERGPPSDRYYRGGPGGPPGPGRPMYPPRGGYDPRDRGMGGPPGGAPHYERGPPPAGGYRGGGGGGGYDGPRGGYDSGYPPAYGRGNMGSSGGNKAPSVDRADRYEADPRQDSYSRRDGQQRTSKLGYFDGPRSRDGAPELGLAGAPHRAVRGTRRIRSPSVARASPRSRSSSSKDTALDTEQQQKAKRVRLSIEDTEEQGSLNDQQPHATLRQPLQIPAGTASGIFNEHEPHFPVEAVQIQSVRPFSTFAVSELPAVNDKPEWIKMKNEIERQKRIFFARTLSRFVHMNSSTSSSRSSSESNIAIPIIQRNAVHLAEQCIGTCIPPLPAHVATAINRAVIGSIQKAKGEVAGFQPRMWELVKVCCEEAEKVRKAAADAVGTSSGADAGGYQVRKPICSGALIETPSKIPRKQNRIPDSMVGYSKAAENVVVPAEVKMHNNIERGLRQSMSYAIISLLHRIEIGHNYESHRHMYCLALDGKHLAVGKIVIENGSMLLYGSTASKHCLSLEPANEDEEIGATPGAAALFALLSSSDELLGYEKPRFLWNGAILTEVLGLGGFNTVYLAHTKADPTVFALKSPAYLHAVNEKAHEMLQEELKVMRLVTHERFSYLPRLAAHQSPSQDWIGLQDVLVRLVDHLHALKTANQQKAFFEVLQRDLLAAVQHLHKYDIVHSDVRADNVAVFPHGAKVQLIDLGLAQRIGEKFHGYVGGISYFHDEIVVAESKKQRLTDGRCDIDIYAHPSHDYAGVAHILCTAMQFDKRSGHLTCPWSGTGVALIEERNDIMRKCGVTVHDAVQA